jgi:hypothetical protein
MVSRERCDHLDRAIAQGSPKPIDHQALADCNRPIPKKKYNLAATFVASPCAIELRQMTTPLGEVLLLTQLLVPQASGYK